MPTNRERMHGVHRYTTIESNKNNKKHKTIIKMPTNREKMHGVHRYTTIESNKQEPQDYYYCLAEKTSYYT